MRQQRDQFVANIPDLVAEPSFELLGSRPQRQIGAGTNQINHGLGLGEVHFAVQKCALGELAGPRGARTRLQARFQDLRGNQCATMATDLDQIFTRVTGRRAMN